MSLIRGSGGGAISVPSDQIFNSTGERDSFFTSNPSKLVEGAQCVVLTSPPEGLYQVYTSGAWQNRTAVVVGPKGDSGAKGDTGDTVKISAIENELDADGKLKTTVSLDDGTSAESTPLQLPISEDLIINGEPVKSIVIERGLAVDIAGTVATIHQDVTHDIWPTTTVNVSDSPFVIDNQNQAGYDYVCDYQNVDSPLIVLNLTTVLDENSQIRVSLINTTSKSNVVQVYGTGFNWHFSTPTTLSVRGGKWRVEESSQMLSIAGSTTYDVASVKTPITAITVDPTSDLTSSVTDDGVLILSRGHDPIGDTVDIVFWWTEHESPDGDDITNCLGQEQTDTVISHTDNFKVDDLQVKSMTARREETSFKYAFFAWPKGFFNPEPTKVDTGFGGPSTWISSEVIVDGLTYKVLTVEITNNANALEDYGLVQEGLL